MSKARAAELKQKLQKLPKTFPENENRVLIREGILFIEEDHKLKPRWCFLFNDCFLETKPACDFADSNTRLTDPSTPYRFKNYIMLNTCHIDESPSALKVTHQKHESSPFILVGHNLDEPNNVQNKKSKLSLIYSTAHVHERALWVTDIHSAICSIYSSINSDLMNYGWQNQYRRGTLFHAVYTLNNDLVRQLLSELRVKSEHTNDDSKEKEPSFDLNEDLKDIAGHNLLHLAVAVNNVDFVEDHGAKFNVDDTDCNGWSALRICVDCDNVEVMRVLMDDLHPDLDEYYPEDKTVNPKEKSKDLDDRTVLHEVCQRGQIDILRLLLQEAQINLEGLDKHGNTPLHIASKKGHEECVLLLLQHGAPPNLADFKGNRPLHCATTENVARWLVAYGARIGLENNAKISGKERWANLDKYALGNSLQPTDCQVVDAVAENNMWFDDKLSNGCLLCGTAFTVWLRRHHCRSCGLLVCQPCSLRKLNFTKGSKDGTPSLERACDKCFNRKHSLLMRKKNFSWKERSHHMRPCEFYQMQIMETTKAGSWAAMMKEKSGKNVDDLEADDMGPSIFEENEQKLDIPDQSSNSKLENGKKKISHVFSKSLGGMRKNKDDKQTGHQKAHTEAMNQANLAISKANERGQKLSELGDKSEEMRDNARNFNDLAKQLANKKW